MSKFTDLILDIEPLYEAGFAATSIAAMTDIDIELVEQVLAHIDERLYNEDMARNPFKGLIA
jgi:hypothetical protein